MGEAELNQTKNKLIIHATIFVYGDATNDDVAHFVAKDIAHFWNDANGKVSINNKQFDVVFKVDGIWAKSLLPEMIHQNNNPRNNYFRIEKMASGNISFVDGLNSNTGYFQLDNLLDNSTTAAHEFGHTLGLDHPDDLDIRNLGVPGIMYPRGTLVDNHYQYNPDAISGDNQNGGTMNPHARKVLQTDIDNLHLDKLQFNNKGFAIVGGLSSIWHQNHQD